MAIVEKKYLLNSKVDNLLKLQKIKPKKITQFYTTIQLCKEVRYRKVDDKYYKTVRTGSEVRKNIVDKKITKKIYNKAKMDRIGNSLKKDRYIIKVDGTKVAIDHYKKDLKNLIIMEKAFKNLQKSQKFKLPESLSRFVIDDVSQNNRYRAKNLALLGDPKKGEYDIYKIFKDIEKDRVANIKDILFKEMSVEDAIRIILFNIYHRLDTTKNDLIETRSIKKLISFKRDIVRSKIVLKEFRYLFKDDIYKTLYKHLNMINENIQIYEDVKILKHSMPLLENIFDDKDLLIFAKSIDERVEKKKDRMIKFLQTREFKIIFNQYKLLIKEQNNLKPQNYDSTSIYEISRKLVKKRFKKFNFLAKKYHKCYDLLGYDKINLALLKLEVMLDEFSLFYNKTDYKKLKSLIAKSRSTINSAISLFRDAEQIKSYINDTSKTIQEQNRVLKEIKYHKKELERKYNENIDEKIKVLRKTKKLFK